MEETAIEATVTVGRVRNDRKSEKREDVRYRVREIVSDVSIGAGVAKHAEA